MKSARSAGARSLTLILLSINAGPSYRMLKDALLISSIIYFPLLYVYTVLQFYVTYKSSLLRTFMMRGHRFLYFLCSIIVPIIRKGISSDRNVG